MPLRTDPATTLRSPSPRVLTRARGALLAWFDRAKRDLPWRRDRDPYRVLVSEVMLQQTRAATVVPYFERWMRRLPSLDDLAAADEAVVLKLWEGLGYYRRARALHRLARERTTRGEGLPRTSSALRDLPGIGPYTAAAIASLAFGERTVAVDGNVRRVGARLFAADQPRDEALRQALRPLLPPDRPGDGNEALIELGATVCTPRQPGCPACPLASVCTARRRGDPEAYPAPRARPAPPFRRRWALVCCDTDPDGASTVWLRRRGGDEMLPGLWGLPQVDRAPPGPRLATVRHAYSHFRLSLTAVRTPRDALPDDCVRHDLTALDGLALSGVDRKLLAALDRATTGA